jgi:hypothetical protein
LDDVLMDGRFGVPGAALDVAGDDQVVRVLADADRVVDGADAAAVATDVEDEVDRTPGGRSAR